MTREPWTGTGDVLAGDLDRQRGQQESLAEYLVGLDWSSGIERERIAEWII